LTDAGRKMLRLPMHPRYSRMLVEASARGCVQEAALCAALVSGRDLLMRLGRDEKHISEARELFEASQTSDFYTLMRAFQFAKNKNFSFDVCKRYGIHAQTARQVSQTFDQLLQIVEQQRLDTPKGQGKIDPLPICLTAGFIDQLCVRRDQGTLDCEMTEGRTGALVRESVVQSPLFVAASIREITGRNGNVTLLGLATETKIEWIRELFPQHLTATVQCLYDRSHKRVAAVKLLRFLDLVLEYEHQSEVDPEASGLCLAQAHLKGYFETPLFNHEVKQLIFRANLLKRTYTELEFPEFDAARIEKCLATAFRGQTLTKEAQATPLEPAFRAELGKDQLSFIEELTPTTITAPDGKKLKIQYTANEGPELQVKLHELFSWTEHPKVCEGRVPVKLWLATPDGKRIEATTDWPAYRKNSYPKIKAALQKRFPGNTWL
jgi:ATP-dependent helicase HrpB